MKFLLDTNTVSFALRGQGRVKERILEHRPLDLVISSITVAELRYGAHKASSARIHQKIDDFLGSILVAPFDSRAADHYGRIEATLRSRGIPIGWADAMIGAHAKTLGLVLVTNNLRHFSRIEGLEIVDWL